MVKNIVIGLLLFLMIGICIWSITQKVEADNQRTLAEVAKEKAESSYTKQLEAEQKALAIEAELIKCREGKTE